MASITDFKRLFDRYQEEGAKQGISIAQYCQMNGIVYNQYERWYKQFRNIVASPVEIVNENVKEQTLSETVSLKEPMSVKPVSRIQIELSNGLQITHREIDYRTLCRLVEKIEGLCVNVPDSALSHKIPIHTFASNQNKNYYGKGNELFRCVRNVPAIQRRKTIRSDHDSVVCKSKDDVKGYVAYGEQSYEESGQLSD